MGFCAYCAKRHGRKGISTLIASVFVILFGVVVLGITLGVVNPALRRAKDTSAVNDAFHILETLNTAIKEVASESDGSRRVVPITITDGTLRVNSTYDWLYFEYEPSEAMGISGEKGDIRIEHGLEFADYFNYYTEGFTATPAWTNMSGQAVLSSGAYSITNGTSYHNVSGPLENWKFSASISNVSGTTGGQVFALPTNPISLVGYWTFDEGSGIDAYDWSGNGNNGMLTEMNATGNATSGWNSASCMSHSCLLVDGFDDYIDAGNAASLNITNTITISAWIKSNGIPSGTIPISHGVYTEGGWYFHIGGSDTNTIDPRFTTTDGNFAINSPPNIFSATDWNHVVITYNDSNVTIFVNGVSKDTQPVTGVIKPTSYDLLIGKYPSGFNFDGTIDEVMIFNRSLSAAEVLALYETSVNKLDATGTQTITAKTNVGIVLSNPSGKTSFDDVKVTRDRSKLTMLVPYTNVELNGTLRLSKGEHKIQIRHMETNTTTSRPIVELTVV